MTGRAFTGKTSDNNNKRSANLSQTDQMKLATQFQVYALDDLNFPFHLALLMDDVKILAFKSGGLTMEQSISFTDRNQVYAYKNGVPFDLALKFTKEVQVEALALRESHNLTTEQILASVNNQYQLEAINLGVEVKYAISKFHSCTQIYALQNMKLPAEIAVRFVYHPQIKAYVCHHLEVEDALKIVYPVQLHNLESGKSLVDSISELRPDEEYLEKIDRKLPECSGKNIISAVVDFLYFGWHPAQNSTDDKEDKIEIVGCFEPGYLDCTPS